MIKIYRYKPFTFWFTTLAITWIAQFTAAYMSYSEELLPYKNIFILIALFTPFIVAISMIYGSKNVELKKDFTKRLCNIKLIRSKYWLWMIMIMPIALIMATTISLVFGLSARQFLFAPELISIGGDVLIILIILALAPTFEEIAWRGYGVDSLKQGRSIWQTTWIYILLWNLWHLPLFFINGYYQNELLHTNIIYALNFVVSLIPAAFLMNWLYYKNHRSIIAVIFFHIMLNLFSVLLQTEQFTKCIITLLLTILSIMIVWNDKKFFFRK
jgi:membrane protease YdiL (CAAX protease family)